jgi:endonuclease YncB( thermonuclease family)
MNQRIAIFLLLLLSHACLQAETITGRVIKVTDGDTVDILDAEHVKHHVRLAGIDAPESKQPFGARAQQKLSALVFGQQVRFEWSKRDRRERPVGVLYVAPSGCEVCEQAVDTGYEVLKAGLAWHYKQYQREQTPKDRQRYSQGEIDARGQQIGLWVDPEPIPPWEWRKAKKLKYQQAKQQ